MTRQGPARVLHRAVRAVALLLLLILTGASPAAAGVYRWTDDDGVLHLTTDLSRVPARYRARMDVIESSPRDPAIGTAPTGTVSVAAGGPIFAEAHLNGVPLILVVDTGASRTVIAPGALARAGIDPRRGRPIDLVGVGGAVRAVEISVPRLDVAGEQIGPLGIVAHELPDLGADGLLGRDVLERFTLTIDAARSRATLTR